MRVVTHCKRGHEYTPENTYVQPSSGSRRCRECARISEQTRRRSYGAYCKRGHRYKQVNGRRRCLVCHPKARVPRRRWEDYVENTALREAVLAKVERGWVTWSEIARECGWQRRSGTTKVRRMLGVAPTTDTRGERGPYFAKRLKEEDALKMMRAIGADPFEVGL